MRTARMKIPGDRAVGYYHCVSRVVDEQFVFHDAEKDHFVSLMRECELFCRVRILTYCVMSNHFHLLVEVARCPEVLPGPEEILNDLRRLSGFQFPEVARQRFSELRAAHDEAGLARYLATFHARMYDVSAFMKLLKQRFTQWFNARRGRRGTLWDNRFKSVLVEGSGGALAAMAAYLDLNPVRAGLVEDPQAYRWCGYGEAMAGRKRARAGLQFIVRELCGGKEESAARSLARYRQCLFVESEGADVGAGRRIVEPKEAEKVLQAKGRLPLAEYLKCRVRYFSDGAVFGGREFVEEIFRANRKRFGPKRKTGARKMRGLAGQELFTLRDLQVGVFGKPDRRRPAGDGSASK